MSVNFSWDTPNKGTYIVAVDPYRLVGEFDAFIDPLPAPKYVPSHATTSNILYGLGFNYGEGMLESTFVKIEELYLGEGCTLLIEVTCGFIFGEHSKIWVECRIKNNELLKNILPDICGGFGAESTIFKIKNDTELHSEAVRYINKALQMMKDRIWPYREQLIEYIKSEDIA